MTLDRRLRRLLVAALIIGFVGALPPRVYAHAVFLGAPASVAGDTDVALTMSVPHERDDTTFNVGIAIRLPEGWAGIACQSKPTWSCSIGVESGFDVVRFDKDPSSAPAEDETFGITVHTGTTPGSASFPTVQTYNTGEAVAWIGAPRSAEPAPFLQVTASPTTTQVAVPPTSAPVTAAPTTAAAAATAPTAAAPTTAPPPTTLSATTTTAPRASSTTTTESAATTTTSSTPTSSTTTELTAAPTTTALSVDGSDSDSAPTGAIVAIVVALLAAGTGAYVYVRRRKV